MLDEALDVNNLQVDEFTSVCLVEAGTDDMIKDLLEIMQEKGVRHLPVKEDGQVVGIVSERDIYCLRYKPWWDELKARDVMTKDPFVVQSKALLREVVYEMSTRKIGSALVSDENGKVFGIFTSIDALNALIEVLQ
ncbi:MAG: CBS domain-containing protein [Bacteriovoracaceae bacterium]|jgi:acetoin utilization protein AcuB|nr:CBS domain-containing protein [Bacteriovoracaceae bacterium]